MHLAIPSYFSLVFLFWPLGRYWENRWWNLAIYSTSCPICLIRTSTGQVKICNRNGKLVGPKLISVMQLWWRQIWDQRGSFFSVRVEKFRTNWDKGILKLVLNVTYISYTFRKRNRAKGFRNALIKNPFFREDLVLRPLPRSELGDGADSAAHG